VNAVVCSLIVELDRAEKIAMIRHRNRRHFLAFDNAHQLVDVARSIEQRIIGMAMKVNEGATGHAD
jgi:hypothetical protein